MTPGCRFCVEPPTLSRAGLFGAWWGRAGGSRPCSLCPCLVPGAVDGGGVVRPTLSCGLPPNRPRGGRLSAICVWLVGVWSLLCCVLSGKRKFGVLFQGFVCLFVLFPAAVVCCVRLLVWFRWFRPMGGLVWGAQVSGWPGWAMCFLSLC